MPLVHADSLDTSVPEYLVEGMIPLTGTGFIWGKSRSGKSLLVNGELALAVANGTDFMGKKVAQGSVAVCLGEGLYDAGVRKTARLARERDDRIVLASRIAAGIDDRDAAEAWLEAQPPYTDDSLYYMTEPFVLPLETGGSPSQSLRATAQALRQVPDLALVILDSFSDFTPSLSISNDASANRAVQGMKYLSRVLDCVVLAVAHPTQKGDKMLGASRLFNAADFVISVTPDEDVAGVPVSAVVSCEKNKYGRPFEPFGYYIEPCSWYEALKDDEGEETGPETGKVIVRSATVRARSSATAATATTGQAGQAQAQSFQDAPRERRPLPDLLKEESESENPAQRKRTGVR